MSRSGVGSGHVALRWERSSGPPAEFAARPDRPITIGREPTNTIAIDSAFVSKSHAVFTVTAGQAIVEDLGSANGTRLNGVPVSRAAVNVGDVLEIGDERLVFVGRADETVRSAGAGLGKTAKLTLAALATLAVGAVLLGLLLAMTRPGSSSSAGESAAAPIGARPRPRAPMAIDTDSPLARDVAERAGAAGIRPVDALVDEALLQYRAGRLRQAAELFAAAVARDPRNELARGRLQATSVELARAVDAHVGAAERAFSQLRFDDAADEWEQVLQLTDARDPRHSEAEAGIQRSRARADGR